MADEQDHGGSARQHAAPGRDAYVAARDVTVNNYGYGQPESGAVLFLGPASAVDPFDLDVHRALWAGKPGGPHESTLTPYLERDHDRTLRDAIRRHIERGQSVF